jgi:TRAP-type mannitol/chloroaromatic compound transport system permease large subunit
MQQVYGAAVPYIVFGLIVLIAISAFPPIATWLPSLLGG